MPEKITIDGSAANEAAIKSYNEEHGTVIAIRKIKYLNNNIGAGSSRGEAGDTADVGVQSIRCSTGDARRYRTMHMIRKKQMVVEAGKRTSPVAEQFYFLAA